MSGFDENPFGDSPFQDPSIQQATKSQVPKGNQSLEDYNPFDDSPQRPTTVQLPSSTQDGVDPAVRGAANPPQYGGTGTTDQSKSPAVMSPTQDNPPPYGQPKATPISTAELQRRQEELERKARELERREAELNNAPFNARKNNWPPIPKIIPLQPCFYQDINVDIPVEFQRIVKYLYYVWMLHSGLLLANFVILFIRLLTFGFDEFSSFFASVIFVLIFVPASYICWFRPAYKAFKSDSSFNFMVFFFVFFAQFITAIAFCTLVPGACGIIGGIKTINKGGGMTIFVGILTLLVGFGFAASAVLDFFLLMRVHAIYRSSGASFAKAQQEFASGVMRNEHVQGAATDIAGQAIRSQMSGSNNSNPNAPRY